MPLWCVFNPSCTWDDAQAKRVEFALCHSACFLIWPSLSVPLQIPRTSKSVNLYRAISLSIQDYPTKFLLWLLWLFTILLSLFALGLTYSFLEFSMCKMLASHQWGRKLDRKEQTYQVYDILSTCPSLLMLPFIWKWTQCLLLAPQIYLSKRTLLPSEWEAECLSVSAVREFKRKNMTASLSCFLFFHRHIMNKNGTNF